MFRQILGRGLFLQHSITIIVINSHIKWELGLYTHIWPDGLRVRDHRKCTVNIKIHFNKTAWGSGLD